MSDRLQETLWKRQDGELSPDERQWLEDRLANDPEARRQAERTAALAADLEALPELDSPAQLRPRIDTALAAEPAFGHGGQRSPAAAPGLLSTIFGAAWRPRLAYLAAGLVLGALVYHGALSFQDPWTAGDLEEVYGTVLPPTDGADKIVDLSLEDDAGTLVLRGRESVLMVELTLRDLPEGVGASGAELTIGGGRVALVALSQDGSASPDVRHADRTLRVSGLGSGRLAIWARVADPADPLEIEVSAAGRRLGRTSFSLAEIEG